jgi:ATP-binding cassette subfamily G (WHITE) protein 2 (PDR)
VSIILALIVLFCFIHIAAAEPISAQRPNGGVLLFRRNHRLKKSQAADNEKARLIIDSRAPRDPTNGNSNHSSSDVPLGIGKQCSILTWDGLSYDITIDGKAKRLLDEVDGWVKPGTLTALMVSWTHIDLPISFFR